MLKLAVEAQLPLIAVSTRDILHLADVIQFITNKQPLVYLSTLKVAFSQGGVYLVYPDPKVALNWVALYHQMVKAEATMIVVNPHDIVDPMFDAGEVPVPKEMMHKFMHSVVDSDRRADSLLKALGGCTLKESAEFARLTMTRDRSLTSAGLVETRKTSFAGSQGLTHVDTAQTFYQPSDGLSAWVQKEKAYFLDGQDPRLIPRGLLFDGPPGVGKTAGAKWLAQELGVPLYRMDVGGTKNKYVGASENRLLTNFARLDNEEPCVALFDEIEKVFSSSTSDASGVTSSMLSQLLWWLAERQSRVLVVMTTNKATALPKELRREGRIDKTLWFEGLLFSEAVNFVKGLLKTFPNLDPVPLAGLNTIVNKSMTVDPSGAKSRATQSALTTTTYEFIKEGGLLST